ncbi:MAG: sialidase family protein [Bacteroidota bacterium]
MSGYSGLTGASTFSDFGKACTDAVKTFAEAQKTAAEIAESAKDISNITSAISTLGELSGVLGVASAAFGLIKFFLPSPTSEILDELNTISNQITALKSYIALEDSQIKGEIIEGDEQNTLQGHIDKITTANTTWIAFTGKLNTYLTDVKNGADSTTLTKDINDLVSDAKHIAGFNYNDLSGAVQGIYNLCNEDGKYNSYGDPYFAAVSRVNNGDIAKMQEQTSLIMTIANMGSHALMNYQFFQNLGIQSTSTSDEILTILTKYKKVITDQSNGTTTDTVTDSGTNNYLMQLQSAISTIMGTNGDITTNISGIQTAAIDALKKVQKDVMTNAKDYYSVFKTENSSLPQNQVAQLLVSSLAAKYPTCAWTVFYYSPLSSFDRHKMDGALVIEFRTTICGTNANLALYGHVKTSNYWSPLNYNSLKSAIDAWNPTTVVSDNTDQGFEDAPSSIYANTYYDKISSDWSHGLWTALFSADYVDNSGFEADFFYQAHSVPGTYYPFNIVSLSYKDLNDNIDPLPPYTTGYAMGFTPGGFLNSSSLTNQTTPNTPAMAVFNNKLYVAFCSNDSEQNLLYVTYDGTSWSTDIATGQTMQGGPAMTVFNGKLYIFFCSKDKNNRLLYISSDDGTNWSSYADTTQQLKGSPAATVFNSQLYVTFCSNDNDQNLLYMTYDEKSGWSSDIPTGQTMQSSPGMTVFNDKLYVVFHSHDNSDSLLFVTYDGKNWSSDQNTGQSLKNNPSIAVGSKNFIGELIIYFPSHDNSNRLLSISSTDGSTWTSDTYGGQDSLHAPAQCFYNKVAYTAYTDLSHNLLCTTDQEEGGLPPNIGPITPNIGN